MQQTCNNCNKLFSEGDKVRVEVTSTYHILKSTVAYALDRNDLQADSSTLHHMNCQYPQGEQDGD